MYDIFEVIGRWVKSKSLIQSNVLRDLTRVARIEILSDSNSFNIPLDFVWKDSKNTCPEKAKCRTFQDVYKDSTYFCEHVYGPFDFAVVSDNTHCMMIFERISDNNFVAAHYAQELVEHSQDGAYQFLSNYTESKEEYCESTLENSSHFKMAHLVLSFVLGAVVTTIVMIGAYCVKRYKNKKVPYTLQSEDDG